MLERLEVAVRPADDQRALEADTTSSASSSERAASIPGREAAREELPPALERSDDVLAESAVLGGLDGDRDDRAAGPEVARQKALAVLVEQDVELA